MQYLNAKNAHRPATIRIEGFLGMCGAREVFLGFASGSLLSRLSFADVLDDVSGNGYQRRFCKDHSLAFKRYIQEPGATTIPLTFNLRPNDPVRWSIKRKGKTGGACWLEIDANGAPIMTQVDCQHRLGYLRESPVEFAFMAYLGLSVDDEMRIFRDINGKAKGLSSSLLDFTGAKLAQADLSVAHPAIALALRLQEDGDSPWQHKLDLGGNKTNGTKRIASLRTMQKAIRRFQREGHLERESVEVMGKMLIDYWRAVIRVYPYQWAQPRRHLISKGIGVYSLMSLAGVLVCEAKKNDRQVDQDYFVEKLSDFADKVDWSNQGPMKGFGGASGADRAFELISNIRAKALQDLHGKQKHPAH